MPEPLQIDLPATCEECGQRDPSIDWHLRKQPCGHDYDCWCEAYVALCGTCAYPPNGELGCVEHRITFPVYLKRGVAYSDCPRCSAE